MCVLHIHIVRGVFAMHVCMHSTSSTSIEISLSRVWCELTNKNRMRCSDLWWLFSKGFSPLHNFAMKKPKSILKVWVRASKWTWHDNHDITGYHRISRHPSELLIPPGLRTSGGIILATVRHGMADAQGNFSAEGPAIYGGVHMATVTIRGLLEVCGEHGYLDIPWHTLTTHPNWWKAYSRLGRMTGRKHRLRHVTCKLVSIVFYGDQSGNDWKVYQ